MTGYEVTSEAGTGMALVDVPVLLGDGTLHGGAVDVEVDLQEAKEVYVRYAKALDQVANLTFLRKNEPFMTSLLNIMALTGPLIADFDELEKLTRWENVTKPEINVDCLMTTKTSLFLSEMEELFYLVNSSYDFLTKIDAIYAQDNNNPNAGATLTLFSDLIIQSAEDLASKLKVHLAAYRDLVTRTDMNLKENFDPYSLLIVSPSCFNDASQVTLSHSIRHQEGITLFFSYTEYKTPSTAKLVLIGQHCTAPDCCFGTDLDGAMFIDYKRFNPIQCNSELCLGTVNSFLDTCFSSLMSNSVQQIIRNCNVFYVPPFEPVVQMFRNFYIASQKNSTAVFSIGSKVIRDSVFVYSGFEMINLVLHNGTIRKFPPLSPDSTFVPLPISQHIAYPLCEHTENVFLRLYNLLSDYTRDHLVLIGTVLSVILSFVSVLAVLRTCYIYLYRRCEAENATSVNAATSAESIPLQPAKSPKPTTKALNTAAAERKFWKLPDRVRFSRVVNSAPTSEAESEAE